MATTKTKPITLFVPFTKIERRETDDALIVEGYCFVNPTVKGDRYSIKRSAMEAATPDYLKFPAVREMHQPIAAGTGLEVIWDDKGCLLRSECVDEGTKKKIDKKVLRGYSIGVGDLFVNRADEVERLTWIETSYVDRPKDPDAVFLYRAEGFDPEQEVEVTVLEDEVPGARCPVPGDTAPGAQRPAPSSDNSPTGSCPPGTGHRAPGTILPSSPAAVAQGPEAAAVSDPADPLHPSLSSTSEDTPSAGSRPAEGDSSHTEEQRGDASRLWAMLAPDVPEEMPETERRALVVEHLIGYGVAEVIAADMAARVDVMRALDSTKVPVRENLQGPKPAPKPKPPAKPVKRAEGEGLDWCISDPETGERLAEFTREEDAQLFCERLNAPAALETPPAAPKQRAAEATEPDEATGTEGPAPAETPPQVSRTDVREETTDTLQRTETTNAEPLQRTAAQEETLTRLAAVEAEVQRLLKAPLEREKPVVRYVAAMEREFRVNQELGAGDDVAMMRKLFEKACQEAETETDAKAKKLAIQRMLLYKEGLREAGVTV